LELLVTFSACPGDVGWLLDQLVEHDQLKKVFEPQEDLETVKLQYLLMGNLSTLGITARHHLVEVVIA